MNTARVASLETHETEIMRKALVHVDPKGRRLLLDRLKELGDIKVALDKTVVVAMTDADGAITYVNDKFCELYKYSREEILGKNHRILKSGEHSGEFYKCLWNTISNGKIFSGEIKNKTKDGTFYWAAVTIVPFLDEKKKPYRYVSFRTDITPIKTAQEEKIRHLKTETELAVAKAAVEARDNFVSMTAHELKTPITSIKLLLELIKKLEERGEFTKDHWLRLHSMLNSIHFQTRRVIRIINDLQDTSRISAGRLELVLKKFNFSELIKNVVTHSEEDLKRAQCLLEINVKEGIEGTWDEMRLEQVVVNLLSNAIKYGHGKPIRLEAQSDGAKVRLSVEDHGIGISNEFQKKLFQRFQRSESAREFNGLGLGLWITQQIVSAHKGRIWVESEVGKGSRFFVELPV